MSLKRKECTSLQCFNYIKNLLERLAEPYEEQNVKTEDFARWNLPDDIANDWEDIDYFLNRLVYENVIDENVASSLKEIGNQFIMALPECSLEEWNESIGKFKFEPVSKVPYAELRGKLFDESIWTHKGLQMHPFWQAQRKRAKQLLEIFEQIKLK